MLNYKHKVKVSCVIVEWHTVTFSGVALVSPLTRQHKLTCQQNACARKIKPQITLHGVVRLLKQGPEPRHQSKSCWISTEPLLEAQMSWRRTNAHWLGYRHLNLCALHVWIIAPPRTLRCIAAGDKRQYSVWDSKTSQLRVTGLTVCCSVGLHSFFFVCLFFLQFFLRNCQ